MNESKVSKGRVSFARMSSAELDEAIVRSRTMMENFCKGASAWGSQLDAALQERKKRCLTER